MARETALYDVLGVAPTATDLEIRKAYRIMALKWHPDKNNHSEESTKRFQQIMRAYEVLFDPQRRLAYDQHGEEGLNSTAQHHEGQYGQAFKMKPDDIFSQFFGNGFFSGSFSNAKQKEPRKVPDINHKLSCTLEELYKGKSTRLGLSRTRLCPTCEGRGGLNVQQCQQCRGCGRVLIEERVGPIMQRFESTCQACSGTGEYMAVQDRCTTCRGQKTVDERKILHLAVNPGSANGDVITFEGEGDQGVGFKSGDVVVTIEEKKHSVFNRRGDDLYHQVKIDLLSALGGGNFGVKHLNGKWLKVEMKTGDIVKPDSFKVLEGYGMPKKNQPGQYGNLLIHFVVEFPSASKMTKEHFEALEGALPPRPDTGIPLGVDMEEITATEFDPHRHAPSGRKRRFDETGKGLSEEDGMGPEGVQCASQ